MVDSRCFEKHRVRAFAGLAVTPCNAGYNLGRTGEFLATRSQCLLRLLKIIAYRPCFTTIFIITAIAFLQSRFSGSDVHIDPAA